MLVSENMKLVNSVVVCDIVSSQVKIDVVVMMNSMDVVVLMVLKLVLVSVWKVMV